MFAYATSTWKPGGLISYVPSQNDKFKLFTSYPAITLKHAAGGSSIHSINISLCHDQIISLQFYFQIKLLCYI
jgi:hypothetical protein